MVERVSQYRAKDGKLFDTREEAYAHELRDELKPITRLTHEQLEAIMRGEDEERAEIMRKVVGAIVKPPGEKRQFHRRTKEEIEADLEAKLAKVRGEMNGSGGAQYAAE